MAKHIHEMTTTVIWGSDINEKIGKIDYIDYNSWEVKQINLCEAYGTTLTDLARAAFDPMYLTFDFLKYAPWGVQAI